MGKERGRLIHKHFTEDGSILLFIQIYMDVYNGGCELDGSGSREISVATYRCCVERRLTSNYRVEVV